MVDTILNGTYTYILVLVRMAGMIAFNPLLARRNVPAYVRTGLVFTLTLLIAPGVTISGDIATSLDLVAAIIKELLAGLLLGFVFHMFYYMLFFVGELMDTQFGLAMAKVFDPSTNVQMSLSSDIINILFVLYIFVSDSHLVLIHMFATSFDLVAAGSFSISSDIISHMLELFISVFSLALRLALPFIAVEFILEITMGILMKLVPQIHVFIINIQIKIITGIALLLLLASPIAAFIENYTGIMFNSMRDLLTAIS